MGGEGGRATMPLAPCPMPVTAEYSLGLRLAAVALLVLANAFFVAAEFSLVAARRTRMEAMIRRGDRRAQAALAVMQNITRYISGTQLGITLTSLGLGWVGEPALAEPFARLFAGLPLALATAAAHGAAVTLAFILITFMHVVLGELVPKGLALLYPETLGRWLARPLTLFTVVTNPFIWLLNNSATGLLRLFGARPMSERERVHSPEEILMLVEQSRRTGDLGSQDARMIQGVFEFSEKNARNVMTPRTQIVALPLSLSLSEAADRVGAAGRSRYPVYRESLDDIVGTVHAKDILRALRSGGEQTLQAILRPPLLVPGTREVEDVLADMKRQKVHLAIVLDEYGGTAGLVTMEDLLEEIVGQIYDEYDRPEPGGRPSTVGPTPIIPGAMEVTDVNRVYGLKIDYTDYTTIGGVVFGTLGRLPKTGDRVELSGTTFEVVEMEGRRVGKVRVTRPVTAEAGPGSS
jgi:CBS domain containing-hemolysin-like protein